MPNYTEFMMRHGEFGVQRVIEQIERAEGIVARKQDTLEQRWAALMKSAPSKNSQDLAA
jgi:hypothetical protein